MSGIPINELGVVSGLVLLAVVFLFSGHWLRSRKVISEYRNILDQQGEPMIRIDIDRLEPRLCNRAFSKLMGYADNAECISLFNKRPHLPQQNFYQIYRLCAEGRTPNIIIQDCTGNGISHSVGVRIDKENESMDLILHPKERVDGASEEIPNLAEDAIDQSESTGEQPKSPSLVELLDPELGVWELDMTRGSYLHNDKWLKHLGYEEETDNNQLTFWQSVTYPGDKFQLLNAINSSEGRLPFSVTYKLANRLGVELVVETHGVVVSRNNEGIPGLVLGTHRDVSGDASVDSTQEFALDEDMDKHDLMNQMATILGYAQLIFSTENLSTETREFADEILKSGDRARKILSGDQDETKDKNSWIQAVALRHDFKIVGDERLPARLQSASVASAIDHVVHFMASEGCSGSDREIKSVHDLDPSCSACSVKQGDEFSSIIITTPNLNYDSTHFRHLLNPGYSTTQFNIENDLLSASELMHDQGGHMRLAMEGGEFSVRLSMPILERPVPLENVPENPLAEILIVDDEPSVAKYLREVVERAGFSTTIFNDPLIALDTFVQNPGKFDLVITDQSMPGLSGEILIQTMREHRPALPVIVCTGHIEATNGGTASDAGAVEFLTKPVDVSLLIQTIRNSLQLIK